MRKLGQKLVIFFLSAHNKNKATIHLNQCYTFKDIKKQATRPSNIANLLSLLFCFYFFLTAF